VTEIKGRYVVAKTSIQCGKSKITVETWRIFHFAEPIFTNPKTVLCMEDIMQAIYACKHAIVKPE